VDRGEAAMRLIHAVRELDRERRLGLETLALHTAAALRPYLVDAVERGLRRTLERRPTCSR